MIPTFREFLTEHVTKGHTTSVTLQHDLGFTHPNTPRRWLAGECYPNEKQIDKIADVYDYPSNSLKLVVSILKQKEPTRSQMWDMIDLT